MIRHRTSKDDKGRPVRIAALLTCHNRKERTLVCLESLFGQVSNGTFDARAFVVDAGSTDGTAAAVRARFPGVRLIVRDGSLYWCGGMRAAFAEAIKEDYDYYLWLNDDMTLRPEAVAALLQTARDVRQRDGDGAIVVGSACDPDTGDRSYGGVVRTGRLRPLGFRPVQPTDRPQPCTTFNGNCVLVPREVALAVGNLSPEFTHAIADTDYGLRSRAMGFSSWVAPGYVGTCRRNTGAGRCFDPALPLRERLEVLRSPKGLPPREWRLFARRHAPLQWPIYWICLYLHACLPRFWRWVHRPRSRAGKTRTPT